MSLLKPIRCRNTVTFSLHSVATSRFFAGLLGLCLCAAQAEAEPRLDQGDVGSKDGAPTRVAAEPRLGVLTTYPDRTAFDAAFPGLAVEDFEAGMVTAGNSITCGAPLDVTGDGTCFAAGGLDAGFAVEDVPGPDGIDGLLLIGDGAFGNSSTILATNTLADRLAITFPEPVDAVAFDLINLPGPADSLTVDVYGPGDVLLGSAVASSSATGEFWGVSSPSPIARVELTSTINEAEAIDNLAFSVGSFLSFDGLSTADACAESTNENALWEPNEEIALDVRLRATGSSFTSIVGALSSLDPTVVPTAAEAAWPDLADGAAATNVTPLRFIIAGDVCAQTLDLMLSVTSDQGNFTVPLSGLVGASQAPEVPLAIPDGALVGATSSLQIDTDVVLSGLEVEVEIEHTWVGDLTLSLRSPTGTEILLLDRPGVPVDAQGCDNNDVRVTFSDSAATDPENVCSASSSDPWVSGAVLPAAALSAFDGESSQGLWILRLRDDVAGDFGTLVSWRLIHGEPLGAECVACAQESDLSLAKSCAGGTDCTLDVFNSGVSTAFGIEVV
ncbi:MAG: proprotein convertase P-domain-containing protein, partial [Acidobacteriota bacterium]